MKRLNARMMLVSGLVCAAAALSGCSSDNDKKADSGAPKATMAAENKTCPVSGEPVNASAKTVAFQGHSVGFCCNGCAEKFAKMDDAHRAEAWKKVAMAK